MTAKEQLLILQNQELLEGLLESYQDSDWKFYLTCKDKLEGGLKFSFFSSLRLEDFTGFEAHHLVNCLVHTFFNQRVKDQVSPLMMAKLRPKQMVFQGDLVEIVLGEIVKEAEVGPSKTTYLINFQKDYEPQLNRYDCQIKLKKSSSARINFEQDFSDRPKKTNIYCQFLKQQVKMGLIQHRIRSLQQQEVAQEICERYLWDFNSLKDTGDDEGRLWDFGLKDLAQLRVFIEVLGQNSPVVILLKAKKIENILAKQIEVERLQEEEFGRG